MLAGGLPLGVNSASAHVPVFRLAAGRAFFYLAFRARQEVAPGRMRAVCTVNGAVSSAGVRRSRPPRIPARVPSLSALRAGAGSQAPEPLPLHAAGFPPQRDSQVGPAPPSRVTRRHGRRRGRGPSGGRERGRWRAPSVAPGCDVGDGRAFAGTPGLKPVVSLVGKLRHRAGSRG